jgi:hypothetical protein
MFNSAPDISQTIQDHGTSEREKYATVLPMNKEHAIVTDLKRHDTASSD